MALLEIAGLTKRFGGLIAVNEVDLAVEPNQIFGLIGPNGAGKTTLFSTISGLHRPSQGRVVFGGQEITGKKASRIARAGLVRTYQLIHLIPEETVFENVRIAHHLQRGKGPLASILGTSASRREEAGIRDQTQDLLERMGLAHLSQDKAGSLAHGIQRICGICMALAAKPRLLLLDEPTAGMSPAETDVIAREILRIRDQGLTVMLVEHDMKVIMTICDRIAVLNFGTKIAEGTPEEISCNEEVVSAYLSSNGKC
jgi:branched-chain amino acid transport system ATP-binding protein